MTRSRARSPETIEFARSRGVEFRLILEVDGAITSRRSGSSGTVCGMIFSIGKVTARSHFRIQVLREAGLVRARIAEQVQQRMPKWEPLTPAPLPAAGRGEIKR